MPEYMMIMKGSSDNGDWATYIDKLQKSGMFRGGSILGNGRCVSKNNATQACTTTGFMKFEADNIDQVKTLVSGNPHYESGEVVEILELLIG